MFNKKSIGLIFVSLMLFSFVAGVVSAQSSSWLQNLFGGGSSVQATFWDPVKDMFSSWQEGDLSVNVAKYLFLILLTIFVYSVVGFIPMIKSLHGSAKFLFALIIGFLATAYLTPSDVYVALAGYSAMGLVLSALLPMVILMFFSIEISKDSIEGGAGAGEKLLSKFMWFVFIVFLAWKLVDGMFGFTTPKGVKVISMLEGWAYLGAIVFSILWILVFEKQFLKILFKQEGKSFVSANLRNSLYRNEADLARVIKQIEAIGDVAGPGADHTKKGLEAQQARLQKEITRLNKLIADSS